MRWLQKRDGDGTMWPWTEALAGRKDMVEVREPDPAPVAPKKLVVKTKASAPVKEDAEKPVPAVAQSGEIDIYAVTDKDELRQIGKLLDPPVLFPGNPSLTTMQAELAAVLGITPSGE